MTARLDAIPDTREGRGVTVHETAWGYRHATAKQPDGFLAVSEWSGASYCPPAPLLMVSGHLKMGREQAAELATLLTHYATTGRLPEENKGKS